MSRRTSGRAGDGEREAFLERSRSEGQREEEQGRPSSRLKFLGFSFYKRKGEVLDFALRTGVKERFAEKLYCRLTKTYPVRGAGRRYPGNQPAIAMGWIGYYRLANTPSVYEDMDKLDTTQAEVDESGNAGNEGTTRYRELGKLGVPPDEPH